MVSEYMTIKEAAELLGIAAITVRLYVRKGVFETAHKLRGTRWRIAREEVEALRNDEIDVSGIFERRLNPKSTTIFWY